MAAGGLAYWSTEFAVAYTLLLESVALARAAGPPGKVTLSQALSSLSAVATFVENVQSARRYGEDSLALAQAEGSPWDIAEVFGDFGYVCYAAGDVDGAYHYYEESLDLFRRLVDPRSASSALLSLGQLAVRHGDYAAALDRQLGDRNGLAFALGYLGEVAFAEGAYEEDAGLLDECIDLFRDLGVIYPFACCVVHRGMVAARLGDYAGAARWLKGGLHPLRRPDYAEACWAA
jgi:tetratricopeptide (TPR) repeat protein